MPPWQWCLLPVISSLLVEEGKSIVGTDQGLKVFLNPNPALLSNTEYNIVLPQLQAVTG